MSIERLTSLLWNVTMLAIPDQGRIQTHTVVSEVLSDSKMVQLPHVAATTFPFGWTRCQTSYGTPGEHMGDEAC